MFIRFGPLSRIEISVFPVPIFVFTYHRTSCRSITDPHTGNDRTNCRPDPDATETISAQTVKNMLYLRLIRQTSGWTDRRTTAHNHQILPSRRAADIKFPCSLFRFQDLRLTGTQAGRAGTITDRHTGDDRTICRPDSDATETISARTDKNALCLRFIR